jgi:FKBP-type peptidyl-prolyl cis-trans isomerase SlyD
MSRAVQPICSEVIMSPIRFLAAICLTISFFAGINLAQSADNPSSVVQPGSAVAFDYTLTDERGQVVDTSKGKAPMQYVHGKGQIIPGLEKELAGLSVGSEKKVTVKPEEAYGPVDPTAFREIDKEKVPPDALKVGTMLLAQGPTGQGVPVRVHEIKEKTVVMDFNHPLAGKTLSFDVKITDIKEGAK